MSRVSAEALFSDMDGCIDRPLSSVTLRRIYTSLLRVHWGDAGNYGDFQDLLGCLVYDDDPKTGTLSIQPTYVYDERESTEHIPGIFIGMAIGYKKSVVNDFAGYGPDMSDTYNTVLATAQFRFTHAHRQPDLALSMAENTTGFLLGIREEMMRRLALSEMTLTGISDVNRLRGDTPRFFGVDLAMQVTFNLGVTVNMESHRLKKFAAELRPTS